MIRGVVRLGLCVCVSVFGVRLGQSTDVCGCWSTVGYIVPHHMLGSPSTCKDQSLKPQVLNIYVDKYLYEQSNVI